MRWSLECASLWGFALVACGGRFDEAPANAADAGAPSVSSWTVPTTEGLDAIWGSGPADIWAVGPQGTIVHFDGHRWTLSASPVQENFTGVTGTGPNDVWATGDQGSVLHWAGSSWKVASQTPETALLGIWASGPSDVWAVGADWGGGFGDAGYVRHWDGSTWSESDVPDAISLWDVWGADAHDVWMVGNADQGTGVVFRGDGSASRPFDTVTYDGPELRAVWGVNGADVWVSPYQGAVEHWNGSTWNPAPLIPADARLFGIAGAASNDVWAVGDHGAGFHYDGGLWSPFTTGTTQLLTAVWSDGANGANPANKIWAVGASATVLEWDGRVGAP